MTYDNATNVGRVGIEPTTYGLISEQKSGASARNTRRTRNLAETSSAATPEKRGQKNGIGSKHVTNTQSSASGRRSTRVAEIQAEVVRRRDALRDPVGAGLVVVRCFVCDRPIATTKVDQAKGEPPVLLDFPENASGWTCTACLRLGGVQ